MTLTLTHDDFHNLDEEKVKEILNQMFEDCIEAQPPDERAKIRAFLERNPVVEPGDEDYPVARGNR